MMARTAVGAVVGLWLGLFAIFVLILWPRRDGDFYEVGDPLVYLGLPVLAVLLLAGALMGMATGFRARHRPLSPQTRRATALTGLVGLGLLVSLYAWGVG
jgi:hypothetical protein